MKLWQNASSIVVDKLLLVDKRGKMDLETGAEIRVRSPNGGAVSATISTSEMAALDVTAGTGTASKALVLDSTGDVAMPANGVLSPNATRNTIANAGTITDAQHRDLVLYQDASVGAVTMTTRTGTQLAAAFPNLPVGGVIPQFVASNHATNTSTIAGGTDVTLVGSGAVTNTGGSFLLIKTAATTFDLVRVG